MTVFCRQITNRNTEMADLSHLFSGDLAIPRGDLSKTLARLEREGYRFRPHPIYPNVIECLASPLDARLATMKEFRNG